MNSMALRPDDIISNNFYIAVDKINNRTQFQFCRKGLKTGNPCKFIGNPVGYTDAEINAIRTAELSEARWKTAGAAVIFVAGAAVAVGSGGSLIALSLTATTRAAEYYLLAHGVGAVATGEAIMFSFAFIDKMNPIHQYAQADALSDDLVNDNNIIKADEEVLYLAQLLEEILN